MNEYTVLATKRYGGYTIEFRKLADGGIYASVTKGNNPANYLNNGEWPAAVAEYVTRKIENYCVMGVIP